jgi:WD40 repeat protein
MEGGRDWWLQITAALDAVEFMVLVMTPAAMNSDLVRKEWRYARQHGVCVYPVKGGDIDFNVLPRWMRSRHFYDLEHEWAKFLNDLRTRCEQRRIPFMADDLPSDFVRRPVEFDRLVSLVLNREEGEPIAITAALRAAGGYGKTMLARALCHHEDVQNAFDDGILWVTLGQNPGDLTGRVEDLIYLLSGQRPGFAGIEAATALLVDLLVDRDILIVIDDVWDASHLRPFVQGGSRCARVITTRVVDAVPVGANRVDVDAMRQEEALALVGYGLADGFDAGLCDLAARLGEWPLLLKLANGALRDRVHSGGQSLTAALVYINKALDRRGLTFFDARDPIARHQAVAKTIELSIELLSESERERFTELAVFPEDVDIPLQTLEKLWGRTGGLDDLDTENLSERLNRLSLTLVFDPTLRYVRLHDVIRKYLIHRIGDRLVTLQCELLEAHYPSTNTWADLAPNEPYLWNHLAYHLKAAGRSAQLVRSVLDLRYLVAKTLSRNALATERDLIAAEQTGHGDVTLSLLRRCFVQASHILHRCETREDLETTLHSRLQHVADLAPSTRSFAAGLTATHVRAVTPLPDLPHPALIRTLTGGNVRIWGCAVSPDASFIVSATDDGALIVWDAHTATERLRLTGHTAPVRRCVISPDGSYIVSVAYDRRVRIWDAVTGAMRHVLLGHTDGITDCAVSADGSFIVTSSLDESLRIWDTRIWTLRQTLSAQWQDERGGWLVQRTPAGHTAAVWGCAVSPDGRFIASASSDQTVKIWDVATGQDRGTLRGHTAAVNGCAFSPDGTSIASAGADRTVRIWDRESGTVRLVLHGHTHVVNKCVFGPDGTWIVSAAADGALKMWDVATGEERATNVGHTDALTDCAVARAGSYIVSASLDGTLKVWDPGTRSQSVAPQQHSDWVNGCAVSGNADIVVSASSDMTLTVWSDTPTTPRHALVGHEDAVRGCAVWTSGREIVSASADKSLKIWSAAGGDARFTLLGHRDWVNSCSISPDERLILSASSDKTLRIWDARTRAKRLRFVAHGDSINACAFSPNGQFFVSASTDTLLKVWALQRARDAWESPLAGEQKFTEEDWERLLEPLVLEGHSRTVNDCAVASDSSFIVSASSDRTLKIWNVLPDVSPVGRSGGPAPRTLTGHRDDVNGCAISPDGALVASVSQDKTLKIWAVRSGKCLTTLHVDGALAGCSWFPDGERIVAVGAAGVYFLTCVQARPVRP